MISERTMRFSRKFHQRLSAAVPKAFAFLVHADSKVFVHGYAATPLTLLSALGEYGRRVRLRDVELVHIHTAGDLISSDPENKGTKGLGHMQIE